MNPRSFQMSPTMPKIWQTKERLLFLSSLLRRLKSLAKGKAAYECMAHQKSWEAYAMLDRKCFQHGFDDPVALFLVSRSVTADRKSSSSKTLLRTLSTFLSHGVTIMFWNDTLLKKVLSLYFSSYINLLYIWKEYRVHNISTGSNGNSVSETGIVKYGYSLHALPPDGSFTLFSLNLWIFYLNVLPGERGCQGES